MVFDEIIHSDQGSTKVYVEEDEQNITLEKLESCKKKNNRLILGNNRLKFCNRKNFSVNSFLCNSVLNFIIPQKFAKISYKQFTPLLFKAIYSKMVHQLKSSSTFVQLGRGQRNEPLLWFDTPRLGIVWFFVSLPLV